jgi:hypothetical protein
MRLSRRHPEEIPRLPAEILPAARYDARLPRRSLGPLILTCLGGFLIGAGTGAFSMYQFDRRLIPNDVPGFEWMPGGSRFDDEAVDLGQVAHMPGNSGVNSRDPLSWPTAGIIAAPLAPALEALQHRPDASLGLAYTDPGLHWHEGHGRAAQLFGSVVMHQGEQHVAIGMREGHDAGNYMWGVFGGGSDTAARQQLDSTLIDILPVGEIAARGIFIV